jgi:hypothetical protein
MTARTKRKPKAKSGRKQGAQPGNKNALRHGFYQTHFSRDESKRLDDLTDEIEIIAEINLIRVYLDRLTEQISFDEITRTDNNGTQFRDTHYLQQLNTLSAMTQSMATLIRTHCLTHGRSGDIQSSILTALEELRLEMGL